MATATLPADKLQKLAYWLASEGKTTEIIRACSATAKRYPTIPQQEKAA